MSNHEVMFYEHKDDGIKCKVCPHNCTIREGSFGLCNTRQNKNGILLATNYGKVTAGNMDPIEKKPLYHYKPGENILSIGTYGCNMTCEFCQNYEISQYKPKSDYLSIERLISFIDRESNNAGVAFTYNEPFMWYEYVYDAAVKIKQHNKDICVVLVTNGYINEEPLNKLLPYIDAMNIDLKAYNNRYYNKVCGANIEPVLKTIEIAAEKCHVEITTLMVSEENDSIEEIENIAKFIGNIDKNIPLHISRYFPRYKMENQPTKIDKMIEAKEAAKKFLNYVYLGNVAESDNNTYCPSCNELIVSRDWHDIKLHINENKCPKCGEKIEIII